MEPQQASPMSKINGTRLPSISCTCISTSGKKKLLLLKVIWLYMKVLRQKKKFSLILLAEGLFSKFEIFEYFWNNKISTFCSHQTLNNLCVWAKSLKLITSRFNEKNNRCPSWNSNLNDTPSIPEIIWVRNVWTIVVCGFLIKSLKNISWNFEKNRGCRLGDTC